MMGLIVVRIGSNIEVANQQKSELTSIAQSRSSPAGYVFRAKLILMVSDGATFATIRERLGTTNPTILWWKERFLAEAMDGLSTNHPGQKPYRLMAALRAKIVNATRKKPRDGPAHWSCRKLANALGVSKDVVYRVWREAGVKLHRLERYMASNDPNFEKKAANILGVHLNHPQHAAVFCVDEKSAIRALDRLDHVLPLSPGRAEHHGFEYYRHGTLSLYAALDTQSGKVPCKTAARYTSVQFVAILREVVSTRPPAQQEIHIILDKLSAHKTRLVQEFLDTHPNVHLHFTPTYSSWLNQVEIWFSPIERDVISRGVFSSVSDLARKLKRYIRAYSAHAKPFRWKHSDPTALYR